MKFLFKSLTTAMLACSTVANKVSSPLVDDQEKIDIAGRHLIDFLQSKSKGWHTIATKNRDDSGASPRVINGSDASKGMYPWYVSLMGQCGGSLITPEYVLTAAHCLATVMENGENAIDHITVGLLCREWDDDNDPNCGQDMETIEIEDILLHPGFPAYIFRDDFDNYGQEIELADDIALIRLKSRSSITPVEMDLDGASQIYLPGRSVIQFGIEIEQYLDGWWQMISLAHLLTYLAAFDMKAQKCGLRGSECTTMNPIQMMAMIFLLVADQTLCNMPISTLSMSFLAQNLGKIILRNGMKMFFSTWMKE